MTENMKKLLQKLSQDQSLAEKFANLNMDTLIAAAKEVGINLTSADLAAPESSMSEAELETVAGGKDCDCPILGYGYGADENDPYCSCTDSGLGYEFNH